MIRQLCASLWDNKVGWTKSLLAILLKIHNLVIFLVVFSDKRPTDICNKMHKQEINQILHILSK
jgi:hypothetical protein